MGSLSLHLDSYLARTVRFTQRLAQEHPRPRLLARACRLVDFLVRGTVHVLRNRRYYTFLKLANMALVNLQFALKTERVWGRPYRMKIESTNICNTHCQLCPTGLNLPGRAKGKMTFEQYRRLINRMHWHLAALDLSMWGDPLIVPDIYKMIRYAHDKGIWTYISSNLHAFKPEKEQARALVESGLDLLTCSLHGASQQTFAIYQPGKSLPETLAKIRHLVEVRRQLKSATPALQLNFVVTRYNEHEIETFRQLAAELEAKPIFSWASLNVRLLNNGSPSAEPAADARRVAEHLDRWLPQDQKYMLRVYDLMRAGTFHAGDFNGHKMFNCSWPWQASVINWDGQVVTCCGSWETSEDMGSVFEQPFGRLWNGRKYRLARRSFKRALTHEQARDNPCAQCPGYMV